MTIKALFPVGKNTIEAQGLYQWDYGQTLEIECPEIGTELLEVHFAFPKMTLALPRPCSFVNGIGTVPIPDQCLEQSEAVSAWIYRINVINHEGQEITQGYTIKSIVLPIIKRTKPIRTHEVPAELVDKYSELLTEVGETVDALKSGNIIVARANHAESANMANAAKSAEFATYATSADNATHSSYADVAGAMNMRLVLSCTITEGEGTLGDILEVNTPYLLVYESTDSERVGSGVIVTRELACVCALTFNHGAYIRNWNNPLSASAIIFSEASTTPIKPASTNGTLYIYTFGHIPE